MSDQVGSNAVSDSGQPEGCIIVLGVTALLMMFGLALFFVFGNGENEGFLQALGIELIAANILYLMLEILLNGAKTQAENEMKRIYDHHALRASMFGFTAVIQDPTFDWRQGPAAPEDTHEDITENEQRKVRYEMLSDLIDWRHATQRLRITGTVRQYARIVFAIYWLLTILAALAVSRF